MRHGRRRMMGRLAPLVACGVALAAVVAVPAVRSSASTAASTAAAAPLVVDGSPYLALGDSVAFGYREGATTPAPDYSDAASFVGYPEDIGADLGLRSTNASCPGETSASFIDTRAVSNGCETNADGSPGYRSGFPLHVAYGGSQLAYAEAFLEAHPGTRLVSLGIGGNDVLICDGIAETDGCAAEMPAVLSALETNVATILAGLRTTAGYTGQIVIVNYYSPEPTDAAVDTTFGDLDDAIDRAARPYDVEIAHSNAAFETASHFQGGNSCAAGLLTEVAGASGRTCGLHPSEAGQAIIAQAVEAAITK